MSSFRKRLPALGSGRSALYGAISYALIAAMLLLWPFRFSWPYLDSPNSVHRLERGGVEFRGPGLILSRDAAQPLLEALGGAGFALEVWAFSAGPDQSGPARIVSCSLDPSLRNFMLGQDGDALVWRLRAAGSNLNGSPAQRIAGVFAKTGPHHLVVSLGEGTERIFVDGSLVLERGVREATSRWDLDYPLLLGNERTGTRPWLGQLLQLAFYARALTGPEVARNHAAGPFGSSGAGRDAGAVDGLVALYRFDEGTGARVIDRDGRPPLVDLTIPPELRIGERELLAWQEQGGTLDRAVNLVAFVPFGVLLDRAIARARHPSWSAAFVLLVGAAFTLSIELLQYFMEARVSSTVDVLLNLLGIGLGLVSSRLLAPRRSAT